MQSRSGHLICLSETANKYGAKQAQGSTESYQSVLPGTGSFLLRDQHVAIVPGNGVLTSRGHCAITESKPVFLIFPPEMGGWALPSAQAALWPCPGHHRWTPCIWYRFLPVLHGIHRQVSDTTVSVNAGCPNEEVVHFRRDGRICSSRGNS